MRLLCASLPSEPLCLQQAQETITTALSDLERCQRIMQGFNQQLLYTDEVEVLCLDAFVGDIATATTSLALFPFDIVVAHPFTVPLEPIPLQAGYFKLLLLSVLAALSNVRDEYTRQARSHERTCVRFTFADQQTVVLHCSDNGRLACFIECYHTAERRPSFARGLFWNIVHLGALLGCGITPDEHNGVPLVALHVAPCHIPHR